MARITLGALAHRSAEAAGTPRPLFLVACAAPPAEELGALVALLKQDNWDVHLVGTPAARSSLDVEGLAALTGHGISIDPRRPDEPGTLPRAAALVVAPATFNTINKWAAGINDSAALGVLNEALGSGVPIVVLPHVKPALAAHPAYVRNLRFLRDAGVTFAAAEAFQPAGSDRPPWPVVLRRLREATNR